MNYSKLQKIVSSFLLFSFFFGQILGLSIFGLFSIASAKNKTFYDLVSIIVTEDVYDDLDNEIERYSEDIQNTLENTKVVILPIKDNTSAFQIASMNESLFYEGYKSLNKNVDFESKLVGTIIIGNINLPIVEDKFQTTKSIIPFVDFEDKKFIYNIKTGFFESNKININGIGAEIFHGIISPNSGDKNDDIDLIADFLDKDHDFYTGKNNFDSDKEVLNGNPEDDLNSNYEPYVFYFDEIREQKSLLYSAYIGYEGYLNNKEDLIYHRYSKELAKKLKDDVLAAENKEIDQILNNIDDESVKKAFEKSQGPDINLSSDISLMHLIDGITNNFLNIFNEGTISDFRTNVHNAGRYNNGQNGVNVDMIPYFISVLDKTTDNVIKSANTDLENKCNSCAKDQGKISGLTIATKVEVVEGLPKAASDYNGTGDERKTNASCSAFLANNATLTNNNLKFNDNNDNVNNNINENLNTSSDTNNVNQCESVTMTCNLSASGANLSSYIVEPTSDPSIVKATINISKGEFGGILKISGAQFGNGTVSLNVNVGGSVGTKTKVVEDAAFANIMKHYTTTYTNFFYGLQGKDVKTADQCSIYKGSTNNGGTLVEANRGYSLKESVIDIKKIEKCKPGPGESNNSPFNGYWGGNTPLNLGVNSKSELVLGAHDTSLSVTPLFDIRGSKKVNTCSSQIQVLKDGAIKQTSTAGTSSIPCDCCKTNFLKTTAPVYNVGEKPYQVPINGQKAVNWTCYTKNKKYESIPKSHKTGSFPDIKALLASQGRLDAFGCLTQGIEILVSNDTGIKTQFNKDEKDEEKYISTNGNPLSVGKSKGPGGVECKFVKYKYYYKNISSEMSNDYPTKTCLDAQGDNQQTPNLPIDKDRRLLFKGCTKEVDGKPGVGGKQQINYPYLFRAEMDCDKNGNYSPEKAKEDLGKFLENYESVYENKYDMVLDLRKFLEDKPDVEIKIGGEIKKVKYYDFLAFGMFWNSLDTVSAKYKFVMEHYLSDQIGGNSYDFLLAKNKKEYEIAYLGAYGDAQNMYIKMDPNSKLEPKIKIDPNSKTNDSYSTIAYKNNLCNSNKLSVCTFNSDVKENTDNINNTEELFKCSPPDGVPIWKWLPAVQCWLKTLSVPKISFGEGNCGSSNYFDSKKDKKDYLDLLKKNDIADGNSNGIKDCVEGKLQDDGFLKLSCGVSITSYNGVCNLKTETFDKNSNKILMDSSSYISYNLKKIVDISTNKVVYDSSKDDFNENIDKINEYIHFSESTIRSNYGTTNYSFSTKEKEADIYIDSSLNLTDGNSKLISSIKSEPIFIKIRPSKLFLNKIVLDNDSNISSKETSAIANDKNNIYLIDSNKYSLEGINSNSIIFQLSNIIDNKNQKINYPINVVIKDSDGEIVFQDKEINSINSFKELSSITKSGDYNIEITDSEEYSINYNFEVKQSNPEKVNIDLGTNIIEVGGAVSTNVVSIYDKFDNIITGDIYNFKLDIIGDSVVFEENDSKQLEQDTFEGFYLFRLKSLNKTGVSKIKIDLYKNDKKLLTNSKNITVLSDLKIDINFSDILKVGNNDYSANLVFKDKNNNILSNLNSRVYLSTYNEYIGLKASFTDVINGKSEIKFSTKILARENVDFKFRLEGFKEEIIKYKDILPGEPMNISLIATKEKLEANKDSETYIKVELEDVYNNKVFTDSKSIISLYIDDNSKKIISPSKLSNTLLKGITTFKINATDLPGVAYLKFSINKDLEKNVFEIGEGDKQIKINGISENVTKLETFYFYKKDFITDKKYNALYTTLIGAEYGDITQKDYLAGAMLFDKNNRSLAVTSLLNNPYNNKDALNILYNGNISKVYTGSDLTQDLTIKLKKDLDGKYYLDIFNKSLNIYIGKIYINYDDLKLVEGIYNTIENNQTFNLKSLFNLNELNIIGASNKVTLDNLLKTKKNSLIVYLESSDYYLRDTYGFEGNSLAISYKDPFSTEYSLNSFSRSSLDTYDNFYKNGNLGWSGGNKSLLAFSSGENVGNATKNYMGVSVINLGDPVISLKKIQKKSNGINKNFDSTIGTKLNKNNIKGYNIFDYNGDSRDDVLLIEPNGYLGLLENVNTSQKFLDQKNLTRVIDIGPTDLINTGDFSGDKYDDIFFVNNKGNPFLLNNNNKDFVRIDLTKKFALKGKIVQAKSFDMDNDFITDIITLDNSGEINIFYGKFGTTNFDKKTIYSGYGLKLEGGLRNDLGAIYFDGLNSDVVIENNNKNAKDIVPVDLLENLMFVNVSYDTGVDLNKENYTKNTKFIKSEFSSEVGLSVEKKFKDINGGDLLSGDIVEVEVKLKNTLNKSLKNIIYLENVPEYFNIDLKSIETDKSVDVKNGIGNYKFFIDKFTLNSGSELVIKYNINTKSLKYGNIKVGLFEKDEAGDDLFGDIIVGTSQYNCGGDVDIYRSTASRKYEKGIKYEKCDDSELPKQLADNSIDNNKNNIPDFADHLCTSGISTIGKCASYARSYNSCNADTGGTEISDTLKDSNNNFLNLIPSIKDNLNLSRTEVEDELNSGYDPDNIGKNFNTGTDISGNFEDVDVFEDMGKINEKIDDISDKIDNFIEGFSCGFGGGSCFGMPINWAPLAPGSDPVVLGSLVGDGLRVDEGVPVFSSLTWLYAGSKCIPTFWPMSPLGPGCVGLGAGGSLGTSSPTNNFRLFVSPTLTGGIGTAACFGAPAKAVGNVPPQGLSPFIPGGNCIVAAAPLPNLCADEEIISDPGSIGQIKYCGGTNGNGSGDGGFGVINGNCNSGANNKKLPITNKIDTNLASAYLDCRNTGTVSDNLIKSFKESFENPADYGTTVYNKSLALNQPLISINGGNFDSSEASISLDFADLDSGINFKGVEELTQERVAAFPSFITQWVNDQLEEFITKLTDFPTLFIILPDFSSIKNADWGKYTDKLISDVKQSSGIKEAYEFLGNVPFVSIEGESINIDVPWAADTLDTTISQWTLALSSYEREIQIAKESGKYSPEDILKAQKFIGSVRRNLRVLESYKRLPDQLANLAGKKQEYLEQILCNVDSISEVTGGWLDRNGKRFKAWVSLYLLVKAILKSWQLLADIFIDYDAECHECKNERYDSLGAQFQLVSMIIPKIPVFILPKWPDVVLDLHNIRLNLTIVLPEFEFTKRPLIIPPLPTLLFPDIPGVKFNLPNIPILPLIVIPDLPDLPDLPSLELPDLPPPPKLPKLFSELEGFLNILKLITKAMCLLKKSPFVPESRAGDQIAFLTEGSGYRPFDFIDLTLPNFSYPYVDEIKITSYVNLEFESEFLVEMAKTIVEPVNNMSNNLIHMFDQPIMDDIDYSDTLPDDINFDLEINNEGGLDLNQTGYNLDKIGTYSFAKSISKGINNLTNYVGSNSKETLSNTEFIKSVNKQLSKEYIVKNSRFDELRESFDIANNYTYSKEDKLISDLQKANFEKFDVLKSILKREINKQKDLKENIEKIQDSSIYKTISDDKVDTIKIYNTSLKKYNNAFIESVKALANPGYLNTDELKQDGEYLLNNIKSGVNNFEKQNTKNDYIALNRLDNISDINTTKNNYLAINNDTQNSSQTCSNENSDYKRNYEGLYVIQEEGSKKISYKLFDYLDDLIGDEVMNEIDFDLDSDSDLLYSMDGNLYLKENLLKKTNKKAYLSGIEVLDINDNKFLNGDIFYEAVNNATEASVSNNFININFSSLNKDDISNYRLEYYNRIDKYLNEDNKLYSPAEIKKHIIDSFVNNNKELIISNTGGVLISKNIAHIYDVGNNIDKIKLKTKELLNIKESIKNGNVAIISSTKKIYTGGSSAKISYFYNNDDVLQELKIDSYSNVEFDSGIKIIKVTGDIYVSSDKDIILNGNEIYDYLDKPLVFDSEITTIGDFNMSSSSHIGIKYYDGSESNLDFRDVTSYRIYDLGFASNNYSINLSVENDYLYSRISVFKENIIGTKSNQVLLSPQREADKYAPEIDFNAKIRIPVYQEEIIDLTDSIYEDSGINNISSLTISGLNDSEYDILKTDSKIRIRFNKFKTIFIKNIKFTIKDSNSNVATKDVVLEVYTPIPEISNNENYVIKGIIDEKLTDEPINLYRYRGGVIKKLENNSGSTNVFTKQGEFIFPVKNIESDLLDIKVNNANLFSVNEKTGKIILNNPLYNIKAFINNDNVIEIGVINPIGEIIFTQIINLESRENNINVVSDFADLENNGIYLRLINSDFDYYSLADNVLYNPGSLAIYRKSDLNKEALFAILKDGRIKTLNKFYDIEYSSFENSIVLKLLDKHFNKEIGQLLLKIDSSYIIK